MKIERLVLKNFRGIRDMDLEFNERLTVLAGVNGAGKSTVLDALATLLSWAVAQISDPSEEGRSIRSSDITNGERFSFAGLVAENDGSRYGWSLLRRKPGFEVECEEPVRGEVEFARPVRKRITETNAECSIPLMVFYPVQRVVHGKLFPRQSRGNEGTLGAYDGSLDGRANFHSFFQWFREQDDIANENRSGREWFIENRILIERHVDRLIDTFVRCAEEADRSKARLFRSRIKKLGREMLSFTNPEHFFYRFSRYLEDLSHEIPDESLHIVINELQYIGFRMQGTFELPPEKGMRPGFIEETLHILFDRSFSGMEHEKASPFGPFLKELLMFTLTLNLWWISDNGKCLLRNAVHESLPNFTQEQADWRYVWQSLAKEISDIVDRESSRRQRVLNAEGRELGFVCRAIESFVPEYTDIRISRKPRPRMLVEKAGQTFSIDQLSDGERCLIAMVGDLARRLVLANPTLDNPLDGKGVVLIDEIDLHLHPIWQRMVAPRLIKTFPGVQFIVSTHSPQVLSHVEGKSVFLLSQTDEGIVHQLLLEAYGQPSERLLEDVFATAARPDEIQRELDDLFDLIQRNSIKAAREKLEELQRRIGTDPELVRAEFLLHRKEEVAQ